MHNLGLNEKDHASTSKDDLHKIQTDKLESDLASGKQSVFKEQGINIVSANEISNLKNQVGNKDSQIAAMEFSTSSTKSQVTNAMNDSVYLQDQMMQELEKKGVDKDMLQSMFITYNTKMAQKLVGIVPQ